MKQFKVLKLARKKNSGSKLKMLMENTMMLLRIQFPGIL
jgi:hypothetical protein